MGCSALTNEGTEEAFTTLLRLIQMKKAGKFVPGLIEFPLNEEGKIKEIDSTLIGKDINRLHSVKKICTISYLKSILHY